VLTPAPRNRISDAAEIREVVENWVVWRDAGDRERFTTVWHPDAVMSATWFHGPAADFIAESYDCFEKRRGIWKIARRQPIYEKDRLDPVEPSAAIRLDHELLARFPDGYCHLAYVQSKNGFTVRTGLPGLRGPGRFIVFQGKRTREDSARRRFPHS
jgi:SnoaL-like domain